ncbi:MAG: glucokinase [Ahrensia sp.]|nr:glucokinase [Ahrensia sp.]
MSHSLNSARSALPFPILIGDIGGTNARFSIVVDAYAEPKVFAPIKTADYVSLDAAIQAHVLDKTSLLPRAAVLAVAGPTDGEEIDLTNNNWIVKPAKMIEQFGFEDIIVLNDYEAQALAVVALGDEHLRKIGVGTKEHYGNCVVIGPGTGLGVAGLIHAANTWTPVAGEGGHVDIGPRTQRDEEVFAHLEKIGGRVSGEQILCGRGIVNLYRAIAAATGIEPKFDAPEDITSAAIAGNDDIAKETFQLFCEYLGRIAGDLALIFMARGGVYLTGGITQKILPIFDEVRFRAGFENKQPHRDLITNMPTFAILHEQAPMAGLTAYARTPMRFGVSLEGRHWREQK